MGAGAAIRPSVQLSGAAVSRPALPDVLGGQRCRRWPWRRRLLHGRCSQAASTFAYGRLTIGVIQLDQHYKQYRKISGANKLGADLHSFTITPEGTAIASLYEVVAADLSSVKRGKDKGWVWDSLFQELDVETGEAIFQWRASEHVDFSDSYRKMNAATHNDPWDFFHINSIEKDAVGNYLVSSRHLRTILYVSGATGDVLWRLGGKSNDFTTFSGGSATSFVGQHDAHWVGNHTAITFFDNGADWAVDVEHGSKGLRVAIDLQNMTAQLNGTYKHPDTIISSSQGSYQTLPNENVLIGWGYNGALTEYAPNGTVLCDAYFEPSSRFKSGDVQSYRNLKFNWTAFPTSDPSLVLANETLYVSWNGATEVRSWLLQDSHTEKNGFDGVAEFTKTGFETDIVPAGNLQVRRYVRAVALDRDGRLLGISPVVSIENMGTVWYHEDEQEEEDENDTDQEDSVDEQGNSTAELEEEMEDVQILLALVCLAMLTGLLVACVSLGWPALKGWRMVPAEEEDGKGMVEADSSNGRLWERLRSKLPSAVTKRHDAAQQLLGPAHQDGGDDRSSDVELSDVD